MSVILFFLIFSPSVQLLASPKLISVAQIYRHGQRTPFRLYPTDPNKDQHFPAAPQQLTNVGKTQLYDLGRYTRERYANVIPCAYSAKFIYAETSDVDRTHMSAQCNLLGLFPPTAAELWNPEIAWSPIPVHPSSVLTRLAPCPTYEKEFARVLADEPFFQNIDANYTEIYEYLTNNSGSNITTLIDTLNLFDVLLLEYEFGFPLPPWTEAVFPEPLNTMAGYIYQGYGFNTKLIRLSAGLLLNELIEHFETMKDNSSSIQFFRMYSGHDLNIAVVLIALGSFKPHVPPLASSLYFELWNSCGTYYVNIYYKNGDTLEKITPSGCPEFDCKLSDLKEQLSDFLLNIASWKAECAA